MKKFAAPKNELSISSGIFSYVREVGEGILLVHPFHWLTRVDWVAIALNDCLFAISILFNIDEVIHIHI